MSTPVSTTVCHQYYIQRIIEWMTVDYNDVTHTWIDATERCTCLNMVDRKYHWRVRDTKIAGLYQVVRAGCR